MTGPGWRSPAARGMVSDTSVPSPGTLRTVAVPPRRAIRAWMDWARPLRSAGTAAGSNPRPRSRTNSATWPGSTSAKIETTGAPDHFDRVDRRLPRRGQQRAQVVVQLAVTDGDGLDGDLVLRFHLLLDEPDPGREGQVLRRPASRAAGRRTARRAARAPGPGPAGSPAGGARRGAGSGRASAGPSRAAGPPCRRVPRPGSGPAARPRGRGRCAATRDPAGSAIAATTRITPASWRSALWSGWPVSSQFRPSPQRHRGDHDPRHGAPAAAAALGQAEQRIGQPPQHHLLVRRRVPPDQGDARHADDQRPGQGVEPARVQRRRDDQHHDSTEARPAARAIPRPSVSALPAMLPSAPSAGISSQATTYAAAPKRLNRAATTKPSRTTVTSRPVRAASPAATPPASRSSRLRRSGPVPGERRIQV